MSVNTRGGFDEVMELVRQHADRLSVTMDATFEGNPPGFVPVDDETFALRFEELARTDPMWVVALPFVKGGKTWLSRYERIRGLSGGE